MMPSTTQIIQPDLLETLTNCVRLAGENALRIKNSSSLDVSLKSNPYDILTIADTENQKLIGALVKTNLPEYRFQGEEQASWDLSNGKVIICDPIDGTWEYANYGKNWGVIIGSMIDGQPRAGVIYQPERNLIIRYSNGIAFVNGNVYDNFQQRNFVENKKVAISLGPRHCKYLADQIFPALNKLGFEVIPFICAIAAQVSTVLGETSAYIALNEKIWDVIGTAAFFSEKGHIQPLTETVLTWNCVQPQPFIAGFDSNITISLASALEQVGYDHSKIGKDFYDSVNR